jgi:polygalacturonase
LQDFGAVGDGVADDSQAFLDAVDAIGREGTILVPEGQYIITKQINIPNRVVIKGEQ